MVLASCPVESMAPHPVAFLQAHIISSRSRRHGPLSRRGVKWFTFDSEGTAGGLSHVPPLGGNDLVSSFSLSTQRPILGVEYCRPSCGINAARSYRAGRTQTVRSPPSMPGLLRLSRPYAPLFAKAASTHLPWENHIDHYIFGSRISEDFIHKDTEEPCAIPRLLLLTSQQRNRRWQQPTR